MHKSLVFSAFGDVPAATKNVGFEKKSCFCVFGPLIEVKSHSRTSHKCRIASRVILGKIKNFEILTRGVLIMQDMVYPVYIYHMLLNIYPPLSKFQKFLFSPKSLEMQFYTYTMF